MITLKSEKLDYGINLPTDLAEVNEEVLAKITANINLPKYYCIVAICKRVNLSHLILAAGGNKKYSAMKVAVVPLLAKINSEDAELIKAEVGKKVVIAASELERGDHLYLSSGATDNVVNKYINEDENIRKALMLANTEVYIIEFKIVPVNSIHGCIVKSNNILEDPFVVKTPAVEDNK